jgi:hypothetical protein
MVRNMKIELLTFSLILYQSKNCGHRIHVFFMMYDVYWYCQMKKNDWLWKFWKRNDLYENFGKKGGGGNEIHAPCACDLFPLFADFILSFYLWCVFGCFFMCFGVFFLCFWVFWGVLWCFGVNLWTAHTHIYIYNYISSASYKMCLGPRFYNKTTKKCIKILRISFSTQIVIGSSTLNVSIYSENRRGIYISVPQKW